MQANFQKKVVDKRKKKLYIENVKGKKEAIMFIFRAQQQQNFGEIV